MKTFNEKVTINDFFNKSTGTWKQCKKPKRNPDYVSYRRNYVILGINETVDDVIQKLSEKGHIYKHTLDLIHCHEGIRIYYENKAFGISSRYWYGQDSRGKYIIRESDHWGRVASCTWKITRDTIRRRLKYGKIYLK